jgi:hypothetical protein
MPENRGDLCSTCGKALACGERSTADRHVFECRGFSGQRREPSGVRKRRSRPHRQLEAVRELPRGLCSDCENRTTCCLAQTVEGGIWHCEEYR